MEKLDRKDFLKISSGAVVGGLAGTFFSGAPFFGLQWLTEWTQDQYSPASGEEKIIKTTCNLCPSKCEISVRMIGNRAVKIETSNSGCSFGQNALQLLYHPERIGKPLKLIGKKGSGKYSPISWDAAFKEISEKLNTLIKEDKAGSIAAFNTDHSSASMLTERLLTAAGSPNTYYEPTLQNLQKAALGGFAEYDFNRAGLVLSFGANILEGWGDAGSLNSALPLWKKKGTKLIHVSTNCSRTASMADEWIPVKPGTESILALGICNYLIKSKRLTAAGMDFARWSSIVINRYPLSTVSELTGVAKEKIIEIANAFYRARNPISVGGRGTKGISSYSAGLIAAHSLNALVRTRAVSLREPAGLGRPRVSANAARAMAASKKSAGIDDFIKNGSFEFLLVNGADPVYKSALGTDLIEKLEKSFVVSVVPLINDTSIYADIILPSFSFLETDSPAGPAVVVPVGKSMHAADIILKIAKNIGPVAQSFPWTGYSDLIAAEGKTRPANGKFSFHADTLKGHMDAFTKAAGKSKEYPLYLLPSEKPYIGDGDALALPYVMKTTDNFTYAEGKLWASMNRETADKYRVSEGEKIDILSERGEIGSVRVHLTDTVAPDVVELPLGFGHRACTKYAKDKGVNPKEIMNNDIDPLTGTANWWTTRVKIS